MMSPAAINAKALTIATRHLTNEGLSAAAIELRAQDGDEGDREFWLTLADGIDTYRRRREAEKGGQR